MANGHENLIPFNKRSEDEAREFGRKGGKASGETRRKKADFRKTLNALLTAEIDNADWTPFLESIGLDSTLESAINAAMIKKALGGDVKAYTAIRDTVGQTTKPDTDLKEQEERIKKMELDVLRANAAMGGGELDVRNAYAAMSDEELEEMINSYESVIRDG